jgi:hypothetical protein
MPGQVRQRVVMHEGADPGTIERGLLDGANSAISASTSA